jgi:hypothetical protein
MATKTKTLNWGRSPKLTPTGDAGPPPSPTYDFVQFRDGRVVDIDYVKAREAGATVSVVQKRQRDSAYEHQNATNFGSMTKLTSA